SRDSWSGPCFVGAAGAVVNIELGAVGGAGAGVVEASAGVWVEEGAVGADLPFLVGGIRSAGVEFDQGVVGRPTAGDIEASAVDFDDVREVIVIVGNDGHLLGCALVAAPYLNFGSVVVDAECAAELGGNGSGD